ncbi:threonine/serine exporter family protein [Trebonia kvetii]|nr:threonine/serine exporter family protein [Trebonia kvetii]
MTATENAAAGNADPEVDTLLSGLTRFLLLHSRWGAFELRDTVRAVGRRYGAHAEILAVADGAVLNVRHADAPAYHDTIRVGPELTRLDLVSKAKFLVNRILAGRLSAAAASRVLARLESSRDPYPWWLRVVGAVLFAVGFAPGVQQTWREAEIAVGQFTPGAVPLAQAAVTLIHG